MLSFYTHFKDNLTSMPEKYNLKKSIFISFIFKSQNDPLASFGENLCERAL